MVFTGAVYTRLSQSVTIISAVIVPKIEVLIDVEVIWWIFVIFFFYYIFIFQHVKGNTRLHAWKCCLKWQSLSLDYRFLMLILLNHYMLNEFVSCLHDKKWLGSQ